MKKNKQKNKKQLTTKQKQTRARTLQWTFFGCEVLSILAPFIALGIVNYEQWFTSEEGWKVGLGGALALGLLGIALWLFTKKKENKELTNGWITTIIGWFAITFIFYLIGSIIDQLSTIMFFGGLGLLAGAGFDFASVKQKEKADLYRELRGEVNKDTIKEQIKKEIDKENGKTEERQATE